MENELNLRFDPTEIDHSGDLLDALKQLLMEETYADVIFIVEGERIPAHRPILAERCGYFRGLLFGNLAEANQREIKLDFKLEPFRAVLRYIYTGHISISMTEEDIINTLEILELAQFLIFPKLVSEIMELVERDLALHNVSEVLNFASVYFDELSSPCLTLIDNSAIDYIQHESFRTLSEVSLKKILQRDSFSAPEVRIFLAVLDWKNANSNTDNQSIFSHIRLSAMEVEDIVNVVEPTKIFNKDELYAAIAARTQAKNLPYRYNTSENIKLSFLPKISAYTKDGTTTTITELATNSYINHILAVIEGINVRYTVQVSQNKVNWTQVIDYSKYDCQGPQSLVFEPQLVRFIKFKWHGCKQNMLNINSSSAMLSAKMPKVVNGIIVLTDNVLIELMSNAPLIRLDSPNGFIMRFNQPYHISSLRYTEWNRFTPAAICTSIDEKDWKPIYTHGGTHGFTFDPHTILFVKIQGSNDPFGCYIPQFTLTVPHYCTHCAITTNE